MNYRKAILPLICLLGIIVSLNGAEVLATWEHSAASNSVASYQVHYGTVKRTSIDPTVFKYQKTNSTTRNNLSLIVSNIGIGIWYFSATATTTNGLVSNFSNEAAYTNRDFAPATLRMTGPTDALLLQSAAGPSGPWKTLAVVTSSNQPLQLTLAPSQAFRTITTNLPPYPR